MIKRDTKRTTPINFIIEAQWQKKLDCTPPCWNGGAELWIYLEDRHIHIFDAQRTRVMLQIFFRYYKCGEWVNHCKQSCK